MKFTQEEKKNLLTFLLKGLFQLKGQEPDVLVHLKQKINKWILEEEKPEKNV